MSTGVLIDTSVISRYLEKRRDHPRLAERIDEATRDGRARISEVTQYEIRRGLEHLRLLGQGHKKIARTELWMRDIPKVRLDPAIYDVAAKLWAKSKVERPAVVFSEADLLIAASALALEMTLLTADAKLEQNLVRMAPECRVELHATSGPLT